MLAVLSVGPGVVACLSHDTALAAWQLCEINPDRIHVTVSRGSRVRRAEAERYVVHREDLATDQVTWWQQLPIVTIPRAIGQGISGGVPTYLLRRALDRGESAGGLTGREAEQLRAELERRRG